MHIAEGFLPPAHAIGWSIAAAPFVVHGARAVAKEVRDNPESTLLLGAAGAFTFVLSALKLPSITGSSSHPTGTGVGAILFRPPVMALLGTVVLMFQALLLAPTRSRSRSSAHGWDTAPTGSPARWAEVCCPASSPGWRWPTSRPT